MRKNIFIFIIAVALTLIITGAVLNHYGETTEAFKVIKTFLAI